MRKIFLVLLLVLNVVLAQSHAADPVATTIKLPEPDLNGKISLEQAIENRRSIRLFTTEPLSIKQVGQLCWSAQGITEPNKGLRTAPSAGALYPIRLYVVLPDGLYFYSPENHSLEKQIEGDIRPMLRTATFGQKVAQDSPCSFVIAGSVKKLEAKYRGRGERLACLEAGHIAENINLQAVTLGLGSVPVGVFAPQKVADICKLTEDLEVLYMVCAGNPITKPALESAVAGAPLLPPPVQSQENIQAKRVAIIVPSQYFSDRQYFNVQNALQLAGIQPVVASLVTGELTGIERNTITATMFVRDIKVDDYDAFVFIGGPGTKDSFNNAGIVNLARAADKNNKIIAATGNAPVIFAYADIVRGRNIASFITQRPIIVNAGAEWRNTSIEINGNMITANGPEVTLTNVSGQDMSQQFGAAIVNMLKLPLVPRPAPSGTKTRSGGSQMY